MAHETPHDPPHEFRGAPRAHSGLGLQEPALAPDGQRGLGVRTPRAVLYGLFRSPSEADELWLASLREEASRLRVLVETTAGLYQARDWFELLDKNAPRELDLLHALQVRLEAAPLEFLRRVKGKERILAAELFLDTRFRVRRDVLVGHTADLATVEAGLAVLEAASGGWVELSETELQGIAARVDLAAAFVRARSKDLAALQQAPDGSSEVEPARRDALVALAGSASGAARETGLAAERTRVADEAARMLALLWSPALEREAAELLRWRSGRDELAAQLAREVAVWDPDGEAAEEASAEVRAFKDTSRRRQALGRARAGLQADPLHAELAYAAGALARFVSDRPELYSHFDRFLAIRGIRVHSKRGYDGKRKLTPREQDALNVIQSAR